MRTDHASASDRSAARVAFCAFWRAVWARISAPMIRPPQITSRFLVLMLAITATWPRGATLLVFGSRNERRTLQVRVVCNLYSITTNQEAIRALFRVVKRYAGNLAPMPSVFPDYPAPVIRNTDTGTEMPLMRWGMPPPPVCKAL
jgi:hypothetical protein